MNKVFETLYGVSKKNKIKVWNIIVECNEINEGKIITRSGFEGCKIKESIKVISKGKNIGKANETSPYEQAVKEAESKWKKQQNKNYSLIKPDLDNYIPNIMLPMLAKAPKKGKIKFPCYIQPKLNGICNLAELTNDKVIHHSRGGKEFNFLDHLNDFIKSINCHVPLHGEIYKHGMHLQTIGSYVKELKSDAHIMEYWIYDIADPKMKFEDRLDWIQKHIGNHENNPIKCTPTYIVNDYDQAKEMHDYFVSKGYEGGMLKNNEGLYMFQYNSDDIEKVKEFMDAEFKIIGGKEGTGLDKGCIVFRCITKDKYEFDVRPVGEVEERKEMYDDLNFYIGKMLTVKFAEYTKNGCPSQPVGLTIRDYE